MADIVIEKMTTDVTTEVPATERPSSGGDAGSEVASKKLVATKVIGFVKWFNVKSGYGFINRSDNNEDVFVHHSSIIKNNPRKFFRSVGDGEEVEFDVAVSDKGHEAVNVTGVNGQAVKGSSYAPDRMKFGGYRRFAPRGGNNGPPRRRANYNGGDRGDSTTDGEGQKETEFQQQGQDGRGRRFTNNRRPFRRANRGRSFGRGQNDDHAQNGEKTDSEGHAEAGGESNARGGGQRRGSYYRRYFRSRRGGGAQKGDGAPAEKRQETVVTVGSTA